MHVVNVAVDDMTFQASTFESVLADATESIETNLVQVAAVGGICNAAVFGAETDDGSEKSISGDATGVYCHHEILV